MPARPALAATPLCDLLDCRYPLILAGMGGVARAELVAAVSGFGGLGILGMVREPLALIEREVAEVRRRTDRPFGVNLIPAGTARALLRSQVDLCIALQVPVVELFWEVDEAIIARLRGAGIVVLHQVGSAQEALQAQAAGAHAIVAQGVEAGGHVRGRQPLMQLLPEVLGCVQLPVAAAGGLADGRDVGRVLAMGAQAAVLGTALMMTTESFAHEVHKQRLVQAESREVLLTEDFHINWPPLAAVRVLPNAVTRGERGDPFTSAPQVIGEEEGRPIYCFSTDSPLRSMTGDLEAMALYAGLGVGRIHDIVPAAERLQALADGAAAHLRLVGAPPAPLTSPVCYAGEQQQTQQARLAARLGALLAPERALAGALHALALQASAPVRAQHLAPLLRAQTQLAGVLVRALRQADAPVAATADAAPAAAAQPLAALLASAAALQAEWKALLEAIDAELAQQARALLALRAEALDALLAASAQG
ncbi:nitronate monooxygenase family protein [Comamonas sp. NLF-1-9]|uniref:NAD(P)H-dependent flavin oxidoreductase n=1 Tax=Comamonas sp. NLF-1-9 TaxID=2853163 RepID=UPI001C44A265|nr:nitronate monooxygenase [Comamonas sp. NLF-1-9]QXL84250.1 nitronate monooxygenase [Comamonas sp. NLF-1-9]